MSKKLKPRPGEPRPLPPKLAELEQLAGEALGYACGFVNMERRPLRSYPYPELNAVVTKLEAAYLETAHAFVHPPKAWTPPEPFQAAISPAGETAPDPLRTVMAWCTAVRDAFRIVAGAVAGRPSPGALRHECGPLSPERVQELLENSAEPLDAVIQKATVSQEVFRLLMTPVPRSTMSRIREAVHAQLQACARRWGGRFPPRGCITALDLAVIIRGNEADGLRLKQTWDVRQSRTRRFYPPCRGHKNVRGGQAKVYEAWELLDRVRQDIPAPTLATVRKDLADSLLKS